MAWDAVTHAIARHLAWPRSSRAAAPNVLLAAKIASYVFAPVALLSGIPVFSVIIRYNLVNEGWPKWAANLFAVVFPWVVALVSAHGSLPLASRSSATPGRARAHARPAIRLVFSAPPLCPACSSSSRVTSSPRSSTGLPPFSLCCWCVALSEMSVAAALLAWLQPARH